MKKKSKPKKTFGYVVAVRKKKKETHIFGFKTKRSAKAFQQDMLTQGYETIIGKAEK